MTAVTAAAVPANGYGAGWCGGAWRALAFAAALLGPPAAATGQSAPPALAAEDLLFEAALLAEGEVKPPDRWGSSPHRVSFSIRRDLVAQGEGTLEGPRMQGTLDWSHMARHLMEASTTNTLTVGWLFTDDGAEIMYEAAGYAAPDPARPGEWRTTAALRFEAPDPPYEWLADVTGVWVGVFDADTGRGRYRAYIPGLNVRFSDDSDRSSMP